MQKVLFAFSGGIDDVLSVHWLRQNRGSNVVALLADMGQSEYLEPLGELALESGAEGTIIVDLRRRFLEDYVFPTLISGAQYEDYLLATPLARYAICEEVVRLACDQSIEWIGHGKPSVLGIASGAVGGLVAITPASGYVGPMGAIVIGFAAGFGCFIVSTKIKRAMGYDDSLDVFGVHAIGGIIGALLTGVFCAEFLGGAGFGDGISSIGGQLGVQFLGVSATIIYTGVVSFIILKALDATMGLRVDEEQEMEGLDISLHDERGYII